MNGLGHAESKAAVTSRTLSKSAESAALAVFFFKIWCCPTTPHLLIRPVAAGRSPPSSLRQSMHRHNEGQSLCSYRAALNVRICTQVSDPGLLQKRPSPPSPDRQGVVRPANPALETTPSRSGPGFPPPTTTPPGRLLNTENRTLTTIFPLVRIVSMRIVFGCPIV